MLNDIVKTVVVHFISNELDKVLVGSDDPSIHNVRVSSLRELVLKSWIKGEILRGDLLPS